ncbi:DUF2786 domain-containing protein [Sphingomonas paucimobilis]|uniref:DNA, contig: SP630 n=1 Tax=Sphingomonas paucimobilis NBRC 13935 TaxID=1219050 RepID=A0A0C9NCU4_SPHPI|nr:DUF2786 domain-containing protein [Sphingomonas paucimobilis]GAN14117.1 hypothetical protein SP6_30_02580 [Sphingomonas paucimobilis NBRC 13935]SUJ08365.1 Protein of uncharacterised function (DUF2786) [Sphingomonas paucimobilis]
MNDALLRRIRKCLALSASSNEHEAANALAMARALMEEHGVTDADIAASEIGESSARGSRRQRPPMWECTLSTAIEEALGVSVIINFDLDFTYIGRGAAPDIAAYAFVALHRRLKDARAAYIKSKLRRCKLARKRARADAFCEGWANAVRKAVAKLAPLSFDDAAIRLYVERHYPTLTTVEGRDASAGRRTLNDYLRGHVAGRDEQLHHGVPGETPIARIGQLGVTADA